MGSPLLNLLLLLSILAVLRHSAAATSYPKEALPTKSGYLTVNSTTGSAIFYSFYEAQNSTLSQTPILIWLQGGPGCSSMLANLFEIGPWLVNQELSLEPNPSSWNKIFGLLFLDNPIGTGFSIAASTEEIPRNQYDVAKHLIIAIKKFVALDKSFKTRPIYITGESYAGKYLPALGYYILKKNAVSPRGSRVNLAGVAIGNGLTDPEIQVATHAVNCYNLGLINEKQTTLLEKVQSEAIGYVRKGDWNEATNARNRVLGTMTNMTGLATLYDFRRLTPYPNRVVVKFLNDVEVKRALGVNESMVFELCSKAVGDALHNDVMKSVRYMVEFLVKRTKVLLYQGQCDLRDGVMSTLSWVKKMKWEGIHEFLEAERKIWRVDGMLAGYVQKWENLSHVVVLNAGHLVPTDQPVNSQVMIHDWLLERGLFSAEKTENDGH
ncbi:UNVERIFIED_CONTAM: Serine carboxypeptidase-like 50 [Sesamum radiatum]|uniref:Carboxypeptidase n=1 Tax=Sesamum radiatum TaxID=300843 RepID=A0AAW2SAZ5_SESRA